MATLESDKVHAALTGKMRAEVKIKPKSRDQYYLILDDDGKRVASTGISRGPKHTLRDKRVSLMAKQLCLNDVSLFIDLVDCKLTREAAIQTMKSNCPPGTFRYRQ